MTSTLDYGKMLFLDAEDLAEAGIKEAYHSMLGILRQHVSEPAEVEEVVDNGAPSYVVKCGDLEYVIYSPVLPDEEGQSWGRATHAFFTIVNEQLKKSDYRLYAINGGNDLGGMFLTQRSVMRQGSPCRVKRIGPTSQRSNILGTASITAKTDSLISCGEQPSEGNLSQQAASQNRT